MKIAALQSRSRTASQNGKNPLRGPSCPQPIPSRTDLENHYWDGTMTLIISLMGLTPVVRGWWLTQKDYSEGEWVVEEGITGV